MAIIPTPEQYSEIDIGTTQFYVISNNLNPPIFSLLEIKDEELNRLEHDITYIVQSYLKCNTSDSQIMDALKNFRLGIFNNQINSNVTTEYVYDEIEVDEDGNPIIIEEITNDSTDYTNLTPQEIFQNIEYWSDPLSEVNTFESKTVEFPYDNNYPLYIVFVGNYIEFNTQDTLQFTSPILAESTTYNEEDNQCTFPVPIKGIISNEENASELTLSSYQTSNSVLVHDFDLGDIETAEDMSILGVQVEFNIDLSDDMIIFATLTDPHGVPGTRSILITKDELIQNNKIILGGPYDLWGFDITDMENLDDWKLEIKFSNPFNSPDESQIIFEDIQVIFFSRHVDEQLVNIHVNGKDTRHYGMFIESVDVPSGLKTDVKFLEIDGTDQNDAYRQNIRKKEITIKFSIDGCTIEETTEILKMIGKLFTNQRDELNRPIPNKLEISIYPEEYWNVILEDPIDSDVEDVCYSSTLKLTVPDGTSYNTNATVTSTVGICSSIAKVNPIIVLIPDVSSSSFEIKESESKQQMIIKYPNFIEGDVMELDCINQKLFLKRFSETLNEDTLIDITDAVDWACDWFSLFGDYNFETVNCMIQTVTFTERG